MNLHNLVKSTTKKKKRVGLGHGSGRVKTSGRGTKGQKARGKIPLDFEGGALPLIKRLPFLRGKGRNNPLQKKPLVINVSALNFFPKDSTVDIDSLAKYRLVRLEQAKEIGVKILGDGELQVPLTVKVPVSKGAAEKIKQAGGTVQVNE
jgi:large subunit ribosomal protein L15